MYRGSNCHVHPQHFYYIQSPTLSLNTQVICIVQFGAPMSCWPQLIDQCDELYRDAVVLMAAHKRLARIATHKALLFYTLDIELSGDTSQCMYWCSVSFLFVSWWIHFSFTCKTVLCTNGDSDMYEKRGAQTPIAKKQIINVAIDKSLGRTCFVLWRILKRHSLISAEREPGRDC